MKVVILAGGMGTRLEEETIIKPKPLVDIGGRPILWHIMKLYSHFGFNDFIICLGYKGYSIKEYFANYFLHNADLTIDLKENSVTVHQVKSEPWKVTLVDTGEKTMTGGRLKRARKFLKKGESFCMTYGDGVGDVDIRALVAFHKRHGRKATVTAVQPSGRFGAMEIDNGRVSRFKEKPDGDGGWVNGGFFVLSESVLSSIKGDDIVWEREPMIKLATSKQLMAFPHRGFWHPMDTLRDKNYLDDLCRKDKAPWKVWE